MKKKTPQNQAGISESCVFTVLPWGVIIALEGLKGGKAGSGWTQAFVYRPEAPNKKGNWDDWLTA